MLDLFTTYCFALLPLVSLLAIELYIAPYSGWGAWAAAPLLLLPAIFGAVCAVLYAIDLGRARRKNADWSEHAIKLLLALVPVCWLFVRRFVL